MTDAAHRVTQSTIEAFAREYLRTLGGSIRENETHWHVTLPPDVDVGFAGDSTFDLLLSDDETNGRDEADGWDEADGREEPALTPGSEFTQRLLNDASGTNPIGTVTLTDDFLGEDYSLPKWLTDSLLDIVDASFSPYYDRTAVCLFVEVDIETVSTYRTEFLEAVSVDTSSKQPLPNLAETVMDSCFDPAERRSVFPRDTTGRVVTTDELTATIEVGREAALEGVRDDLEEIRRTASRAASTEFEEYRQLREQQLDDLRDELRSVRDALADVAVETADADSPKRHVDTLRERRRLGSDERQLEQRRSERLQERERGYRRKRREIYERHTVDVTAKPIATTLVDYERGELTVELHDGRSSETLRAPYAVGADVVDDVRCDRCNRLLSETNPVRSSSSGLGCRSCK